MTYFMPGEKNAKEMFNYYMEGVIKRNHGNAFHSKARPKIHTLVKL